MNKTEKIITVGAVAALVGAGILLIYDFLKEKKDKKDTNPGIGYKKNLKNK